MEAGLSSDAKVCDGLRVLRHDFGKRVLLLMPEGAMDLDATSCRAFLSVWSFYTISNIARFVSRKLG